jgi:hypothetical protein
MVFTGRGQPPRELAGSAAVRQAVAEDPALIGYIEREALDPTVRQVLLCIERTRMFSPPPLRTPGAGSRLARWLGRGLDTHISLPLFAVLLVIGIWILTLRVIDADRAAATVAPCTRPRSSASRPTKRRWRAA